MIDKFYKLFFRVATEERVNERLVAHEPVRATNDLLNGHEKTAFCI